MRVKLQRISGGATAGVTWVRLYLGPLHEMKTFAQSRPPTDDITVGAWTTFGLGDGLSGRIDEDVPDDDTSYIQIASTSSECEMLVSGIVRPIESYADWFRRTCRGDTLGLQDAGLYMTDIDLEISAVPGDIPLGFRIKNNDLSFEQASVIDQVLYLDPNDNLASGYFSI